MEIQGMDAQPLRYGRHQYRGAVRADRPGNKICYAYLKPGEALSVQRGAHKTVTRERQLNSMLRQMWFGYRYQATMSFPAMNPKHMFIYSGMVYRIRPRDYKYSQRLTSSTSRRFVIRHGSQLSPTLSTRAWLRDGLREG